MNVTPLRSTSKARPALRLISTKELPREDWLAVRKQGIGSSDAGAAVGLNPYKSQLELWLEKTGRDTTLPKADPHDEESPMYWGNVLEPIVAWHYSKRTKNKVRRINAVLQHPNPNMSWMLANIDREVISADDVQILECKTAGINGARLWKEGVRQWMLSGMRTFWIPAPTAKTARRCSAVLSTTTPTSASMGRTTTRS